MAGDWIPVRIGLAGDPDVLRMAAILKLDRFHVAGLVVEFWGWASQHSSDGILSGLQPDILRTACPDPRLVDALLAVGWLELRGEDLVVPRWENWLSGSAKARLQGSRAKRVRRLSGSEPDNVRQVSGSRPDKNRT